MLQSLFGRGDFVEFAKKFQYSLVLFVICFTILAIGFIPSATALFHRLSNPDDYKDARGVITHLEPKMTAQAKPTYWVTVEYVTEEGEEVTAILEDYVRGMEVDMEIGFIYAVNDPTFIVQSWSQIQDFLIHGSFVVMSFLVALMMMNPASAPYEHRKPKTLRERLEIYGKK